MADVTVGELQKYLKDQGKDINAENMGWAFNNMNTDPAPFSNESVPTNGTKFNAGSNINGWTPTGDNDPAPFSDETAGKTPDVINQNIANQKAIGMTGSFKTTEDKAGGYTTPAYDENNNKIFVRGGEYVKGASLTPKVLTKPDTTTPPPPTDTTGGTSGTDTTVNNEDKLFENYLNSLKPTTEELDISTKLNDEQTRLENAKIGIMSDPAEMRFLTGQEANVEKRSLSKQNTLQRQLALEQAKREMSSTVSKAQYERADKKAETTAKAKDELNKYYIDLDQKGYTYISDPKSLDGIKESNLFRDPYSKKIFLRPTTAGNDDIYTFKETDEKTGKNYVIGINKKTGTQVYKTDINVMSKVTGTGSGTKEKEFTLSSTAKETLIGAGISLPDIKAIQDNINKGYTVDEIISSSGVDESKTKAIKSVFGKQEPANEFADLADNEFQSLIMNKYTDDNGEFDITKAPSTVTLEAGKRGLLAKEEPTSDKAWWQFWKTEK